MSLGKPRWPNGPAICEASNLPAFETDSAMRTFRAKYGPSCKTLFEWECTFCQRWHCWTVAPDPAGNSSGTGRGSKTGREFTASGLIAIGVPKKQAAEIMKL